ncbi:MAG: hypothetical protein Kow0079_06770 [Vicingaceae bacterium]
MNLFLKIITAILILFAFSISQAQDTKTFLRKGNDFFNSNNFIDALENYLEIPNEELDEKINYRIGVCYLNTNIDKSKAIPYLEKVISSEKPDPNAFYLLGRAYHFAYKFDEAIKMYEKFKEIAKGTEFNLIDVDKQIEYCYNAKELLKFPVNVTFENLGENINSPYKDYYPFISEDEDVLFFNSKRDDGSDKQLDGSFTSEIYYAKVKNGKFSKAKKLDQNINTLSGNEEIVGLSDNGKYMILYFENEKSYGDLFIAEFDGKNVVNIEKLPKEINSKSTEIAASISHDGNAIYFASDREGGFGGVDIYVSRKLPNGKWGPAQNLGATINTPFDEDFPNIAENGKYLYFSSKGHTSMGGYDIFKAQWNPEKNRWVGVKNVGYPINTPEDNTNFRSSKTGRTGYISALRAKGYGDYDIYSITFNDIDPTYTVVYGYILDENNQKIPDSYLSVIDLETDEIYGEYLPNPKSGRYIMILPPGKYNLMIETEGYQPYTEDIEIYGKSSQKAEIKKDFILKK